jgi:hypothetical protein
MNPKRAKTARSLIRDVLVMQLKLLTETLRDIALSPILLSAAALDLLLSKRQAPRYFHQVMRLAERSDQWIDMWSAAREPHETEHANIDQLLHKIEEIVQDPKTGARRARVLRRWAERRVARAAREAQDAVVKSVKPPTLKPPPPPGRSPPR